MKEALKLIEKELTEIPKDDDPAFEDFILWVVSYPDEAQRQYPRFYKTFNEAIQEFTSWEKATIFEAIAKGSSTWLEDANKTASSLLRQNKLRQHLQILKSYKNFGERTTDTVIKAAYKRHKEFFDEYIVIVEQELREGNSIKKEKPVQKKNKLSYVWQGKSDEELPNLYQQMKGKFIDNESDLSQFIAIFSGLPIQNLKPIKWHSDNASEVLYFILQLEDTQNIASGKRVDYQKLKACFFKPDGTPFTASFKELKQNIDINLSTDKQRAIKDLVSTFT